MRLLLLCAAAPAAQTYTRRISRPLAEIRSAVTPVPASIVFILMPLLVSGLMRPVISGVSPGFGEKNAARKLRI